MTHHFTLDELVQMYASSHPDWSQEEILEKARELKRELKRMDQAFYRSQKRYRSVTQPLSTDLKVFLESSDQNDRNS